MIHKSRRPPNLPMRAQTIIHLIAGDPVKTATPLDTVLLHFERLEPQGTLLIKRLTDHGSEKRCFCPRPTVLRVEEL